MKPIHICRLCLRDALCIGSFLAASAGATSARGVTTGPAVPTPEVAHSAVTASQPAAPGPTSDVRSIDARLARHVDLDIRGGDLRVLVDQLTRQTGIRFYARPDVADWKLTVLVSHQPVSAVMQQVAKLFHLTWFRLGSPATRAPGPALTLPGAQRKAVAADRAPSSGLWDPHASSSDAQGPEPDAEAHFTYSIAQTVRERLAENQQQQRDRDAMLLSCETKLEAYRDDATIPPDQLKALSKEAFDRSKAAGSVEDHDRWFSRGVMLRNLAEPGYRSDFRLYTRLSPDQLLALRAGQTVDLAFSGAQAPQWPLVEDSIRTWAGKSILLKDGRSLRALPPDQMQIVARFQLAADGPGRASLSISWRVPAHGSGVKDRELCWQLLSGSRSPHVENPANRQTHQQLSSDPRFTQKVTLEPDSGQVFPLDRDMTHDERTRALSTWGKDYLDSHQWIDSAGFFDVLHRKTGLNVVADHYMDAYLKRDFCSDARPLLDALDDAADTLKSDWQPDGPFLRFHRFDASIQRALEPPNRLLEHWKQDRERHGYLTLDDLSEMAALPDDVLTNMNGNRILAIKWGLADEHPAGSMATELRFYADLSPLQKAEAQQAPGLPLGELTHNQLALVRAWRFYPPIDWKRLGPSSCVWFHVRPAGTYAWTYTPGDPYESTGREDVLESTRARAESAVEAFLKARGAAAKEILREKRGIRGPWSDVWVHVGGYAWGVSAGGGRVG